MERQEVIKLMTNTVQEVNRQIAIQMMNVPANEVETKIAAAQEHVEHINGMIYDLLVDHGVIKQ
jgi:hypothetical protein